MICSFLNVRFRYVLFYQITAELTVCIDSSWEKRQATATQRLTLWRVTRNILTENDVLNPLVATPEDAWARNKATRPKFDAMEHIFWVKVRRPPIQAQPSVLKC